MPFGYCEMLRWCGTWNEINPLTPADISHGEAIFHVRSAFHKSRKGFISGAREEYLFAFFALQKIEVSASVRTVWRKRHRRFQFWFKSPSQTIKIPDSQKAVWYFWKSTTILIESTRFCRVHFYHNECIARMISISISISRMLWSISEEVLSWSISSAEEWDNGFWFLKSWAFFIIASELDIPL